MSLTLHVDTARWIKHLSRHIDKSTIPVAKGNGYGFGIEALAAKAGALGADTIAVGTYDEARATGGFTGDVLVLTPWRPGRTDREQPLPGGNVIHTVSRLEDLRAITGLPGRKRVVVERLTSLRRFGMSAQDLWATMFEDGVVLEGVAFHLPLQGDGLEEADRLMHDVVAADLPTNRVLVSHLTPDELTSLRATWPDFEFRPRVGTGLWLGDRGALRATATVLDVHPVDRGEVFGYRAHKAPRHGHVVVVSGGTSHGIGLEAPSGNSTIRTRAVAVAKGGLEAVGFLRSPYSIAGRQARFAEPPHMQVSLLWLPGDHAPAVGDEVEVAVRYTTTTFDRISWD